MKNKEISQALRNAGERRKIGNCALCKKHVGEENLYRADVIVMPRNRAILVRGTKVCYRCLNLDNVGLPGTISESMRSAYEMGQLFERQMKS